MDIFFIIWFIFAAVIVIGGISILAIYKGYCESKNNELSSSDEESILTLLFMIAALPITLFVVIMVGICHLPYFFGKILGKYL